MELKLDTNALSYLIEADNQFKLNLQQAVLQNIADRYIKSAGTAIESELAAAARKVSETILNQYTKIQGTDGWSGKSRRELNGVLKDELQSLIKADLDKELPSMMAQMIETEIAHRLKRLDFDIGMAIRKAVDKYTEKAIADTINKKMVAALQAAGLATGEYHAK